MRYRRVVEGLEKSDREIEEEIWWRQCAQEQDNSRSLSLSTAYKKTWGPLIIQRKTPGVRLEEWGIVAKWLKEVPSYYFTLTIFGDLEVFFVSFLLLYYCFVILIKYSRAQKGQKNTFPYYLFLCCSRAERLFEWFEVLFCVCFMKTL